MRYFFFQKQTTIVNLINLISIGVVLVATASLFIVLSAFSGLKEFGLSFSNSFDPDLRIETVQGKTLLVDSLQIAALRELSFVEAATPLLEEKIFLNFRNKNHVAYLKGVEDNYQTVVPIDSLIVRGIWFVNDFDEWLLAEALRVPLALAYTIILIF